MSWLFSIPLRTVNNTKTQENVSVCIGPESSKNAILPHMQSTSKHSHSKYGLETQLKSLFYLFLSLCTVHGN